jgi:hypothetical protein
MAKITSWKTKEDGTLIESDFKFYPYQDGTYEVEYSNEEIGFLLGRESISSDFTVIKKFIDGEW